MASEALFLQVKRKLNVTWSDAETDARIEEMIDSAIPTLKQKLGIFESDFDFESAGEERNLFKNYCLYEWNHCVNEFDDNYANEIAQIQAKWAVKYEESVEDAEDAEE